MKDLKISDAAIKMILSIEGLSHADWPGGASGVTIGRGYDLGYHTPEELLADWGGLLPKSVIDRLSRCCGLKGIPAREYAKRLTDIRIPVAAADKVFLTVDVPRWIRRTATTFPGYEMLPDSFQGALVSLVFNRGTRMSDVDKRSEERREMRAIREAILRWSIQRDPQERRRLFPSLASKVASELRSMKRLWEGKKLGGLLRRREAEAALVEGSVKQWTCGMP